MERSEEMHRIRKRTEISELIKYITLRPVPFILDQYFPLNLNMTHGELCESESLARLAHSFRVPSMHALPSCSWRS